MEPIEIKTYNQYITTLTNDELGKYILIKGDQVFGTFHNQLQAIERGYDLFRGEGFMVRKLEPFDLPIDFSNNVHLV